MPNYGNAQIYRLVVGEYFYIGSTCVSLQRRLTQHKSEARSAPTSKRHFKVLEYLTEHQEPRIECIEAFPCNNAEELREREDYWIRLYRHIPECLNSRGEFLTDEEREAYKVNYRRQRLACTCGSEITAGNIAAHRRSTIHTRKLLEMLPTA